LLRSGQIAPGDLARVAVSLDSVDVEVQDHLRGRGAWRDATALVQLLGEKHVMFDINVTAVRSTHSGIEKLIAYARTAGARRVNIHWPSRMGIGHGLPATEIPTEEEWRHFRAEALRSGSGDRDFFVEVEKAFLDPDEQLSKCALSDSTNLQIMPDGRVYRCGLLIDDPSMASLAIIGSTLVLAHADRGEQLLAAEAATPCFSCPLKLSERRACIYDKMSSQRDDTSVREQELTSLSPTVAP
jgi:MoaA/NifB/PqqE/SkfB family radical SAM enzyme